MQKIITTSLLLSGTIASRAGSQKAAGAASLPPAQRRLSLNASGALTAVSFAALSAFVVPMAHAGIATMEADNDIYISGLGSYQTVTVTYEGVPKESKKTSNECGYIRLASSTSTPINTATDTITFQGNAYLLSDVPSTAALKCTNGILEGTIVGPVQIDAEGRVYLTGLSAFTDYQVQFNSIFTTRKIKSNTCGIAKISNSSKYNNVAGTMTLVDTETSASLGTLPDNFPNGDGPLCKRGVGFYPVGYPTSDNF